MTILTVPKVLFNKLGKDESDAFLEVIGKAIDDSESKTIEKVEDKFEKRLIEEFNKFTWKFISISLFHTALILGFIKWLVG